MLLFVPSPLSFVTGLTDDALDASRSRECESGGLALWTRGPLLAGSILLVLGFAVPFLVLGSAASLSTSVLESFSAVQLEIAYGIIVLGVLQARGRQAREVRITIASRPAALKARRSTGSYSTSVGPSGSDRPRDDYDPVRIRAWWSIKTGSFLDLVYAFGPGLAFAALAVGLVRKTGALSVLRRKGRRLQLALCQASWIGR